MFSVKEGKCVIALHKGVEEFIDGLDEKARRKIFAKLKFLSEACQFNKPEQWRPLKGTMCRKYDIWELKPKPYRLAFFKDNFKGKTCFVVFAVWKKEGGKKDRELIERICGEAASVKEFWHRFKQEEECEYVGKMGGRI